MTITSQLIHLSPQILTMTRGFKHSSIRPSMNLPMFLRLDSHFSFKATCSCSAWFWENAPRPVRNHLLLALLFCLQPGGKHLPESLKILLCKGAILIWGKFEMSNCGGRHVFSHCTGETWFGIISRLSSSSSFNGDSVWKDSLSCEAIVVRILTKMQLYKAIIGRVTWRSVETVVRCVKI